MPACNAAHPGDGVEARHPSHSSTRVQKLPDIILLQLFLLGNHDPMKVESVGRGILQKYEL